MMQQPVDKVKEAVGGTLEVRVLSARDLKSVEMFGRQDPFFKVIVGTHQPWQSRTCVDGGKKPVWNETNKFPISGTEPSLRLEVWDHNAVSSNSLIGGAVVPLTNVLRAGSEASRVVICDQRGKTAGEVELVLVFHKDEKAAKMGTVAGYGQMAPGYPGQQMPGQAPGGYPGQAGQPGHQPAPVTVNIISSSGPGSLAPNAGPQQGYPPMQSSNPYGAAPAQASNPYGAAPAQAANPYGGAPSNPYGGAPSNPYGNAAPGAQNPYGAQQPYGAAPDAYASANMSNPYGVQPQNPYAAQGAYPPSGNIFGAPPPQPGGYPPSGYGGPSV